MIYLVFIPLSLIIVSSLIAQVFIPGFPKETLLLLSGINYGLFWGSIINWIGMVLAAQVGYEVVLHSVKVGGRFATILVEYEDSIFVKRLQEHGNLGLFFVRLIPYAPNDVLSLLSGALFLPRRGFVLVSLVTAIPYAIFFAYLGVLGSQLISMEMVWSINLGLFLISLIIVAINYLWQSSRPTVI